MTVTLVLLFQKDPFFVAVMGCREMSLLATGYGLISVNSQPKRAEGKRHLAQLCAP